MLTGEEKEDKEEENGEEEEEEKKEGANLRKSAIFNCRTDSSASLKSVLASNVGRRTKRRRRCSAP